MLPRTNLTLIKIIRKITLAIIVQPYLNRKSILIHGQPYQWITSGLAPRQCSLATMLVSLPQCSLLGVHRVD